LKSPENKLRSIRCANHKRREAAVKCLTCNKYFCRECITEYQKKMLCTDCLEKLSQKRKKRNLNIHFASGLTLFMFFMVSFFIAWLFFFWSGQILASIPQKYHDVKTMF